MAGEDKSYAEYSGWRRLKLDRNGTVDKIPAGVIDDRDHRLSLSHATITAQHFGDPLPGYSAADRRETASPSIVPDPLNGLIFRRGNEKKIVRYG